MDRKDVLKRLLYPKCKSAIEFKFDTLIVNPLLSYITVQDIAQLNKIATSIKYSSKPKEKYAMIDNILVPRGFKKMASGTNRVVYRFLNDYRIVLKVAIDKVGLSDNGNEYRNQYLLKPFVTKCFEVSPCGTVGLFERVVPITSREEFINISDDVFDLINNLIGKYVLEDIGEKYYMNYGLREGFGPVLLDYPYVFELDGRKLICNVPEPLDPKGYCGGEIDYDLGYNNLICKKCGKRYLATELRTEGKSGEKPKIIVKGDDIIMKCVIKRGNEIINKLNSEQPDATNTIKPREQFNKMKGGINRNPVNKENHSNYRPNIRNHDEVTFKARLKGTPRSKDIDKIAREKEKKSYENVKSVPVSFAKEDPKPTTTDNISVDLNKVIEKPDTSEKEVTVETAEIKANNVKTPYISPDGIIYDYEGPNNHLLGYTEYSKFINSIKSENYNLKDEVVKLKNRIKEAGESRLYIKNGEIFNSNNERVGFTEDCAQIKYLFKRDEEFKKYEDSLKDTSVHEEEPESNDEDNTQEYSNDQNPNNVKEEHESFGTTIGELLKDKNFLGNSNYKTNTITSPVENHFSNSNLENENNTKVKEEEIKEENTDKLTEYELKILNFEMHDENAKPSEESSNSEIPELTIHPRKIDEEKMKHIQDEY